MKTKFLILTVVFCLCLAGCAQRNSDAQSSAESLSPFQSETKSSEIEESEHEENSSKSSKAIEKEDESSKLPKSDDKSTDENSDNQYVDIDSNAVTFIVAENAHTVNVVLDVPKDWHTDSERASVLVADGKFEVEFNIVSNMDSPVEDYNNPYFTGLDKEFAENDVCIASGELSIPNTLGKYYHTQAKNNDTDLMEDELHYYVCIGNKSLSFTFKPAKDVNIETVRKEFETCLFTLKIS